MGRKSSVELLPPETKSQLDKLLADGRLTLDGLKAWLDEQGQDVSRSALGRYKQGFDQVAAKLRESREVVDALVAEMGPDAAEGKHGRMLVEVLRSLVFDHLKGCVNGDHEDELGTQDFFFLAKSLKEMSQSLRLDQDFEIKIREQVRKQIQVEQQRELEDAVATGGFDPMAAEEARRILGFA